MATEQRYQNHPQLAKFNSGWGRYVELYGVTDAALWRAYCIYLADHDEWDGEPLYYNQWLAAREEPVRLAIAAEFGDDADAALERIYAEYAALTKQPLPLKAWLAELERVAARHMSSPVPAVPLRPCFRVQR